MDIVWTTLAVVSVLVLIILSIHGFIKRSRYKDTHDKL